MGFQDDWMMRQIEMITRFVANVVFGKQESDFTYEVIESSEGSDGLSHCDEVHLELCRLIREGRLNDAEDMLYDEMEYSDRYIQLASDFYRRLNRLTDEELEAGGFSRDEIYDGYIDMMALLGVPVDVFGQADRTDYE